MRDIVFLRAVVLAASALLTAPLSFAETASGQAGGCGLVIAGGALAGDNEAVWRAFMKGARDEGDIVIVPAASGYPSGSGQDVANILARYGWPAGRIEILPLAVKDDPDTPDVDEARWAENATSTDVLEAVRNAAALWFTGGDQARIAQLFGTRDEPRALLESVDAACRAGAAIGGTSAGAAMMSDPMLRGGDSLPALLGETDTDKGALQKGPGLGFFRQGLVDQHFGERSREGRLIVALLSREDRAARLGFGIDENTAMIVSPDGTFRVEGDGHITVIDARQAAARQTRAGVLQAERLVIHMLARGDTFESGSSALMPADWRKPTVGHEYFDRPAIAGGGLAVPRQGLADLLGEGLLDNAAAQSLRRITYPMGQGELPGLFFDFEQIEEARGFWGRDENGRAAYTIANIRLDIRPVRIEIKETE